MGSRWVSWDGSVQRKGDSRGGSQPKLCCASVNGLTKYCGASPFPQLSTLGFDAFMKHMLNCRSALSVCVCVNVCVSAFINNNTLLRKVKGKAMSEAALQQLRAVSCVRCLLDVLGLP